MRIASLFCFFLAKIRKKKSRTTHPVHQVRFFSWLAGPGVLKEGQMAHVSDQMAVKSNQNAWLTSAGAAYGREGMNENETMSRAALERFDSSF